MGNFHTAVVAGALLAGLSACSKEPSPPTTQPTTTKPPAVTTLNSMDEVNRLLADRVRQGHQGSSGYAVFVTNTAYPIGTILPIADDDGAVNDPVEYDACAPAAAARTSSVPSLFVNQSLSNAVAANFGIDNALIKSLADAGVNVSRATTINLSFLNPQVALLSQNEVKAIVAKPVCSTALGDKPVWLVRGYVIAKRNFVLSADRVLQAHGSVTGVAKFNFDAGSGKGSVSLVDEAPQNFIQILSKVTPRVGVAAPAITAPVVPGPGPIGPAPAGRIYIQRASSDSSDRPGRVLNSLRTAAFSVEPHIQALDASKIPKHAEVRYFYTEDEVKAAEARLELLYTYGDVRIVKVNLPSPRGQLEVWLPEKPGGGSSDGSIGHAADAQTARVTSNRPGASSPR